MTDQEPKNDDDPYSGKKIGLMVSFGFAFAILFIAGYLMIAPSAGISGEISTGETVDVLEYDYEGDDRVLRLTVVDGGEHAITEVVTSNGSIDTRQRHDIRFTSGQAIGHNDVMGEWGLRLEKTGETEYSWRVNFVPLNDTVAVEYGQE